MADDKKDIIEPITDGTFDDVADALIGGGTPREEIIEDPIEELPIATWKGKLNLLGVDVPCYVLSDGQKIIGRTSATELLTGVKGGGKPRENHRG